MRHTVIIADDFTGAGDSGVTYARAGLRTAMVLNPAGFAGIFHSAEALTVTSESRFMNPGEAAATVRALALRCRDAGGSQFFKKVDSAMRGHTGTETEAVLRALDLPAALVCPALPQGGRVVADGILLVNGQPVNTTALGRDPFTPVRHADLRLILGETSDLPCGVITLDDIAGGVESVSRRAEKLMAAGCRFLIADAATDDDLRTLAVYLHSTAHPDRMGLLPVGSSGLARAMAGPAAAPDPVLKGRLLAVVGSLNEMALRQADHACREDHLDRIETDVAAGLSDPATECERLRRLVDRSSGKGCLLRGRDTASPPLAMTTGDGSRVAGLYGRLCAELCRSGKFEAVYVTGGSTAVAVAEALGIDHLFFEGEILPGVVVSSCTATAPGIAVRTFVTKAGSFGDQTSLSTVAAAFCQEAVTEP